MRLEDLLPVEQIHNSISKALTLLKLNSIQAPSIKELQSDRPISSTLSEFKNKNAIDGNLSTQFEEKFKDFLYNEVEFILNKIDKEQNIPSKKSLFRKELTEYYTFFEAVLDEFNLKINADETLSPK
ncbi:MAG: hypothetical protein M5T52_16415 [Ignavibacteriaceae bacterium]|nr:hypothetical protein [Ignavibacteriaceae bacterium]